MSSVLINWKVCVAPHKPSLGFPWSLLTFPIIRIGSTFPGQRCSSWTSPEVEFRVLLSEVASASTHFVSLQTWSHRGGNARRRGTLSSHLGLFHGSAGCRRVPAEEMEVGSKGLQRAAAGEGGGGDGSQHRWVPLLPLSLAHFLCKVFLRL